MAWYDKNSPKKKRHRSYSRVIVGGFSGTIVTVLLHPLDLVKVRLQLYPKKCSTIKMARKIVRCEGVSALYNGMTAGIMRQATFTTTRLAVYYYLYENYTKKYSVVPGLNDKRLIGLYASIAAALAGNPSDVALVRMMGDCRRDPCSTKEKRHKKLYNGAFHALYKIATTEGYRALWRGSMLTVSRTVCVGVVQAESYMHTYNALINRELLTIEDDGKLHIYASIASGFLTAIISLPVDTLKTRYQVRSDALTQTQVLVKNYRKHGILYFWQGFIPYFIRLAAHTTLTYFLLQQVDDVFYYITQLPKQKK